MDITLDRCQSALIVCPSCSTVKARETSCIDAKNEASRYTIYNDSKMSKL